MTTTKETTANSGGKKRGLDANIQAKRKRIAHGSGEHMREPGAAGAPAADAFEETARKAAVKKKPSKPTRQGSSPRGA